MVLDERVKLIGKINSDIADWLLVCNRNAPPPVKKKFTNIYCRNGGRLKMCTLKA